MYFSDYHKKLNYTIMNNKQQLSNGLQTKKALILFTLFVSILVLSGCTINLGFDKKTSLDAGFFASYDKGEKWLQKSELLSVGGNRSFFKSAQAVFLKIDPKDPKTLYMGTIQNGLFYSYDKGNGWQRTLVGKGIIRDIAIDPKFNCTLYVAAGSNLYKSIDCSRRWWLIHIEGGGIINSVAIDYSNNNKIYIGLNDGRILKSENSGVEWKTIAPIEKIKTIKKILINPKDSQKIYVATDRGIFKSENEGYEWKNISENIKDPNAKDKDTIAKGAHTYKDIVFDSTKDDAVFYANAYGLFYSEDGGNSWENIKLITKINTPIYSIAVNPKNSSEIYYSTSKLFYKSIDFGRTWASKKTGSTKTIVDMLVDSENENNIFSAMRDVSK